MVSIIIPTYNRGYIIKRCIESIINQSYKNIEIIVVDDNSDDDTSTIVNSIEDSRLKYFKFDCNKGACAARNYGIQMSTGDYIAFQDSDDVWREDKLQIQLNYLLRNNLDVVSSKIRVITPNAIKIFPDKLYLDKNDIYIQNKISTQTILAKKECFQKIRFDERLPRFQDWDLAIELINKYNCEILDETLVDVYMQENSISINPKKAIQALDIFVDKHGIDNIKRSHYFRLMGVYSLQLNESYKKYFIQAFKENPFNKKNIIDCVLSLLNMREYHYSIYKKMGRFK